MAMVNALDTLRQCSCGHYMRMDEIAAAREYEIKETAE
jgi:hypothetical protein